MKTQILYRTRTGNTEMLAKAIFEAVPGKQKDIAFLDKDTECNKADLYFIGFWTDRGSASVEVLDYLANLQGKKIALFGTCGMGDNPEYYKKIEENIKVFIEGDNEYLGAYLCQGKMPMAIREKYVKMKNQQNEKQVEAMLRNFDRAMLHPDERDIQGTKMFVQKIFEKIKKEENSYE